MNTGSLFVMYLFYGLSFINLGFASLFLRSGKYTSDTLLKNLFYLGMFGILHGLSEWIILFRLTISPISVDLLLSHIILSLNGVSFLFLANFGLLLNRVKRIPTLIVWLVILITGIISGYIFKNVETFVNFWQRGSNSYLYSIKTFTLLFCNLTSPPQIHWSLNLQDIRLWWVS